MTATIYRSKLNEIVNELYALKYAVFTRTIYLNTEVRNYSEALNDNFIIIESIRKALIYLHPKLKDPELDINLEPLIENLNYTLIKVSNFQQKWNLSYTTWYNSYKSNKGNKYLFLQGDDYLQLSIQVLFPNVNILEHDYTLLLEDLRSLSDNLVDTIVDIEESITKPITLWEKIVSYFRNF